MKINIVDVISKYVELRKLGPGYTGICPFCGTTGVTDFVVSLQNQHYSCNQCGARGGLFSFLVVRKDLSLEEALKEVRETFNITFNAHYLDSQWNNYLQGTDFQQVLKSESEKAATFFKAKDLEVVKSEATRRSISYTEVATFIRCPLEYKYRYIENNTSYQPTGTRVNVGRFLHTIASQFLKQPVNKRNLKYLEDKFQLEINKKRSAEYISELERFQMPTIMLLQDLSTFDTTDRSLFFKTQFDSFTLVGTVDCLLVSNTGIQIIEFKEYDYRVIDDEQDLMRYLQLYFYYFGLGGREAGITMGKYCFFNNGDTDDVIFSDELIDRAKEYISGLIGEMTDCRVYTATPNSLCPSCGYREKCDTHLEIKGRD